MTGQPLASPGPSTRFIGCRADLTGPLSILDTTFTTVDLTTSEIFDTDGFHDMVTNPSRLTVPAGLGGVYEIVGYAGFNAFSIGTRLIRLLKNGTGIQDTLIANAGNVNAGGAEATRFQCVCSEPLVAGDFIQLQVRQTSGGALNLERGQLTISLKGGFA